MEMFAFIELRPIVGYLRLKLLQHRQLKSHLIRHMIN